MADWLNSFRLRLTLLIGGLSLAMGFLVTLYINDVASGRMTQASGEALEHAGRSMANALAETLREREREIVLLSQTPLLVRGALDSPDVRRRLDQIKDSYRHYAWIGVADPAGVIVTANGGLLEGENAGQRPWFIHGRRGAYIGDVHNAVLLAKKLQPPNANEPLRFVDFASPVYDDGGRLKGVVATHAHWRWAGEVLRTSLPRNAADEGIEAFIVGSQGQILHPYERMGNTDLPTNLPQDGGYGVVAWDGQEFLTSLVAVRSPTATDLGWKIVVRQPIAKALAPVAELHRNLLILGTLVALLFMFLSYGLAFGFSRPIEQLSRAAYGVQQGDETTSFATPSRLREIRILASALGAMTATLLARKQDLEQINATLEDKVAERTAQLENANRALAQLARRDALTGLNNRLAANEHLREEFLRMKRTGIRYAVLVIDIDHFKRVNDTFGHETGDEVLKHVAGILKESSRITDFVARFGGEEFLVLLPSTDSPGAGAVAQKLVTAVASSTPPTVGRVTISVGLAAASPQDPSEDEAVRLADKALYQAKANGRNRVERVLEGC